MFEPKYQITPNILKSIGQIEAAKAVIENSPLLPLYERQFKSEATARKVHFSTAIEGNYLKLNEVRKIIDTSAGDGEANPNVDSQTDGSGSFDIVTNSPATPDISMMQDSSGAEVIGRKRDINEVINYRNLVRYIEKVTQAATDSGDSMAIFDIVNENSIKEMHSMLLSGIKEESGGVYRVGTAVTVNYATGEKLYPYEDVGNIEVKMRELIAWYNSVNSDQIHPVLKAGIMHLELVKIHPFEDGNGRIARAMATLSLSLDGYDVKHFFCLDEYYDSNAEDYYYYLGEGFKEVSTWLEYFALGMAIEFNRIKDRVTKISKDAKVKEKVGQMFITERQEQIIEWLNNYSHFRNQDFETLFPGISDDTVLRELKGLIDAGIVTKKGKTKSARYELVS